jgi:hypothetical protein
MTKKSFLTKTLCTLVLALGMSSNLDAQLSQSVNMSKSISASDPSPPIERDGLPIKRAGIAMSSNLNPIIYGGLKLGREKQFYDLDPDSPSLYTTDNPDPKAKSRFSLYFDLGFFLGRTPYRKSSKEFPVTLRNLNAYELKLSAVPIMQADFFVANDLLYFGAGVIYGYKHHESTKKEYWDPYSTFTDETKDITGIFSPYVAGGVNLKRIFKKMKRTFDLDVKVGYMPKTKGLPTEYKDMDKEIFPFSVGIGYRPDVYKPIKHHKAQ